MNNLTPKDFYKPTKYNSETLNQIWMSTLADTHDIWCDCNSPFAHLLSSIFPPGHQDRDLTVNQILKRDYKQCRFGGAAGESGGGAGEGPSTEGKNTTNIKEEDDLPEDELADLISAAEEAQKR